MKFKRGPRLRGMLRQGDNAQAGSVATVPGDELRDDTDCSSGNVRGPKGEGRFARRADRMIRIASAKGARFNVSLPTEEQVLAKVQARQTNQAPRERLLDAAYDLFASNGEYPPVGVSTQFSPKSGCAKASLYSNFQSKVDLAVAVFGSATFRGRAGGSKRRSSAAHRTQNSGSWPFSTFLTAGFAREISRGVLIHQRVALMESKETYSLCGRSPACPRIFRQSDRALANDANLP